MIGHKANPLTGRRESTPRRWPRGSVPLPSVVRIRVPSRAEILAYSLAAIALFIGVQLGLQWLLYVRIEGGDLHALTAIFSACFVGLLVYSRLELTRQRRIAHRRRFETIAEANHHIRNALEAMEARFYLMNMDPEHTTELRQSVDRIKWVLKEVLPDLDDR